MFRSPATIASWSIAILIVAVMGVLVLLGPFHKVNKVVAISHLQAVQVTLITDPRTTATYKPSPATVRVGQQITFTNNSDAIHTVTSRDGRSFDSGNIGTGGRSWTLIPSKTGHFPYYCAIHPDMHGVLVVKA